MRSPAAKSIGGLLFCLGVALAWTSAQLHWHPTAELWHGFIFRDAGHVLTIADQLLQGRTLYKDIFYQYGPFSAWFYASVAAVVGNSPATLLTMQQALSLVVAALAYRLLRSALPQTQTILFLIIGLFPLLLQPGSSLAEFSGLDYVSWERILLLAIALAWKPPEQRTGWYAVTQGGLLGSLQLIKFGSAFVAGAALLLVDLFYLREFAATRSSRRHWLVVNLILLAAFAVVEGGWIGAAFSFLPHQIAWDAIWPFYMLESYASYVIGADRWPRWQNAGYLLVAQLPAVTAVLLVAYSAVREARSGRVGTLLGDRGFGGFAFLAVFFFIGLTIYFQHVWHIYQYLWAIMLAAGWAIRYARLPLQAALLALWLPAFAVSAKALLPRQPAAALVLETFPNGDKIWLEPRVRTQLAALREYLVTLTPATSSDLRVLFFPDAGGLHHFLKSPPGMRFFWFTGGGLVQKGDEAQFSSDFSALDAVVVFFKQPRNRSPGSDPAEWSRELFSKPAFGSDLNQAMRSVLADPVRIDDQCWVFPVQRTGASEEMRTREDSNFKPSDP